MNEKAWVKIPSMYGAVGESAVTFIDASFLTKDGIVKKYPDPDFGSLLITEIYDKIQIFAIKKGLFRKKYLCPSCGEELNLDAKRIIETEHKLRIKELPPFAIRISLPSVECSHCHKICGIDLDGTTSFNLNEAIIRAFDTENIKP